MLHLTAELLIGLLAIVSGLALVRQQAWARALSLFALGMLAYSSIIRQAGRSTMSPVCCAHARDGSSGDYRLASVAASHNSPRAHRSTRTSALIVHRLLGLESPQPDDSAPLAMQRALHQFRFTVAESAAP